MTMFNVKDLTPVTIEQVRNMTDEARGYITRLFLHWTGGWYGQAYDEYHFCIDQDGSIYAMCDSLTENKNHTWHRNTGAIGISLLCCGDASANNGTDEDLGSEPPTKAQIEAMSKLVQVLCDGLGLDIDSDSVMTHCEIALIDGYGPGSGDPETRWDLWYLYDNAQDDILVPGGQLIRDKAAWYHRQAVNN